LSYKDVEFTDYLIREISATVGRASDEAILEYVRSHKNLTKGFQIKKSNCATFRKKINQHISTMHELDDDIAGFLYSSGIGSEFVTVLSHFALDRLRHEFAAIFGHAAFTLALLLDERIDVQKIGCQLLAGCEDHSLDRDAARMLVAESMQSFATHFSYICTGTLLLPQPLPVESHTERIAELERQLKAERKLNNEISSILKDEKKTTFRQLSEKTERIEKLVAERDELRSSRAALQSQIEILRKEIEQIRLSYDTNIT